MKDFICVAFKANKSELAHVNLMMLSLLLCGYEAFWFSCPDFRAPMERNHHEAWLLYTNAPIEVVMSVVATLAR